MKMKCFHYPQSFTLIIDFKFNFLYGNCINSLTYCEVIKPRSNLKIILFLYAPKTYILSLKRERNEVLDHVHVIQYSSL